MRYRVPPTVFLRRAQLTLAFVALIPTVLLIAVGIVLLAVGSGRVVAIVSGVLVLAFCSTAVAGYILGSLFMSRGASSARFQSDFVSAVSHELRTPLTSIGLFIESIRDERLTDPVEKQRCFELLQQELERLRGLVEKMVALSKIEAGRYGFHFEPIPAKTIVSKALVAFRASIVPEHVEPEIKLSEGLEVVGDEDALIQVIGNLLINAWKHGNGREYIRVHGYTEGKWAIIDVADRGPGVASSERKQIFQKFRRGEKALTEEVGGLGLGLATVHAIVNAHSGRVDVHGGEGAGALFRVRLRRRKNDVN